MLSHTILQNLVGIFNDHELELLISGLPEIDVDDLRAHTEYTGYTAASPIVQVLCYTSVTSKFKSIECAVNASVCIPLHPNALGEELSGGIFASLQVLKDRVSDWLCRFLHQLSSLNVIRHNVMQQSDPEHGLTASCTVQWFWEVVRELDKQDLALLVQFVTGTSKVPLEGFKALQARSIQSLALRLIGTDYFSVWAFPLFSLAGQRCCATSIAVSAVACCAAFLLGKP